MNWFGWISAPRLRHSRQVGPRAIPFDLSDSHTYLTSRGPEQKKSRKRGQPSRCITDSPKLSRRKHPAIMLLGLQVFLLLFWPPASSCLTAIC